MKKRMHLAPYIVEVDTETNHGWFEHDTLGDEQGGELWFIGSTLMDYDGVFALPRKVGQALIQMGYTVEEDYLDGPAENST